MTVNMSILYKKCQTLRKVIPDISSTQRHCHFLKAVLDLQKTFKLHANLLSFLLKYDSSCQYFYQNSGKTL